MMGNHNLKHLGTFSKRAKVLFLLFLNISILATGQISIEKLKVDYMEKPLGIDIQTPNFSWQMQSNDNKRGHQQQAYQIIVTDEDGLVVWDSKKQKGTESIGITYQGEALQGKTRYIWKVIVYDENGKSFEGTSWFETGVMESNPKAKAWNNAEWIGGSDDDLVFYSHYLSVFKLEYAIQLDEKSKSTKGAIVFGANDKRLMDKNLNVQGVENGQGESFVAFELDISQVDGSETGLAQLHVYRVGYDVGDTKDKPIYSFPIPNTLVNLENKYDKHTIYVDAIFGLFDVYLDEREPENRISKSDLENPSPWGSQGFNLNPVGRGNDYISFPMVADIGFWAKKGQKMVVSELKVKNFRSPSNDLFHENLQDGTPYSGVFEAAVKDDQFSVSELGFNIVGANEGAFIVADPSKNAAPMLRSEFALQSKEVKKARLYVTSRGVYEIYLNGERVGDSYFTPGLTQYNKHQMYQTYDLTEQIKSNGKDNVLGAWLGEGWWSGNITYSGENWNYFGDRQSLFGQLIVTYTDGTEQVLTTNARDWKLFTDGPVRYGSFFQGEVYDAAKERAIQDWSTSNYDDSFWKSASEVPLEGTAYLSEELGYDDMQLVGQIGENPSIVKTLAPKEAKEVRPGVFVYDMGQNMVGFPEIDLPAGKAGDTITLRYAEVTYPDLDASGDNVGMVMLENIRAALAQDIYIRKGGKETIRPRFTFHGFRYLELTGVDEGLPTSSIKGHVISSIKDLSSKYETSNELVNRFWENITWSLRGNFLSIPTDTPARNERMGWSGDINVFSEASTYLANVEPFLKRHLLGMRDIQREDGRFTDVAPVGGGFGGTLWGSAGIVIPWELYQQYGDVKVLEEHYDAMKDYLSFLDSKIDKEAEILNEGPLGDWLSPEGFKNDNTLFWTAYHLYNLDILKKTASILGKTDDASDYKKQYQQKKEFFNNTYVNQNTGKTVHSGFESQGFGPPPSPENRPKKGDLVDTQASYAIPLHLKVFNDENQDKAVDQLVASIARKNVDELGIERPEYSLMTGFIGTASLNHALSENGKHETAYRLLQQTTYPSWLYPVINGATTIWERLNSYTIEDGFGGNNSMNSFNHYSFGAVAAWMYNYSLGIQRDPQHPGFKHFKLEPIPDPTGQMTWAKGYYDSMYGRIKSEWNLIDGGWEYKVSVPANTTATLKLKADTIRQIKESGKKLKSVDGIENIVQSNGEVSMELQSGSYSFMILNK
ncbi:family 78 glycoside hydrolase catalytic domain [Flagellimonas sp. GZD32]|uniref:alpha-L-rhamnosidase n=1 Tax=Flagellimonas cixiensis TaxID=3228750 RepID=UPI0035C8E7B3